MANAVIFDIDGTLVDSVDLHAEAWRRGFEAFGKHIPFEALRAQIGKGADQLLPCFLTADEIEDFGAALQAYRNDLFRREYLSRVLPFPGVRHLFQRLRADGKRVALASSAKKDEIVAYQKIADIEDLVNVTTSADDVERSKPHPDIFQIALRRLALSPAEAVVVGDTSYDAEAASRAGIGGTIGLLCGGASPERLREAGCREIYGNPADLLDHVSDSLLAR
jgi:HAD superfamily hydrolase (TIGR01509 family)